MAHTLPDYSTKYKMTNIFGQIDTGELAARLGSINRFDRRGNTIWYDDFEGSCLTWSTSGSGTGWSVTLNTANAWTKTQSVKMLPGTTINKQAYMTKYLPAPATSIFGVEFHLAFSSDIDYILMECKFYDGVTLAQARLKLDIKNDKIQYWDSGGNYVDLLDPANFYALTGMFHSFKMVLNYTSKEFVRLMYDYQTLDMSNIALKTEAQATEPVVQIEVYVYRTSGTTTAAYVDSVILTQNEE